MPSPMPFPSSGSRLVPKMSTKTMRMRTTSGKPKLNMTSLPGWASPAAAPRKLSHRYNDTPSSKGSEGVRARVEPAPLVAPRIDGGLGITRGADGGLDRPPHPLLLEPRHLPGRDLHPGPLSEVAHPQLGEAER